MARSLLPSTLLLALGLTTLPAMAQITPDGTLNTIVTLAGTTFTITGGATSGTNLFHSFSQFSVPTGGTAYFNNAPDITNIFGRVTGGSVSNIDGLIQANGTANLFLLNPNGIIFGPGARLDIGGSFIGTTANSIQFADGVTFSATNPTANSLLTVSVPVGLQMGQKPAPIRVQGTGHNISVRPTPQNAFPPFTRETNPAALTVRSGRTLALVGGGIALEGGQLVAEWGRIELGSVGAGQVSLTPNASGFALSYGGVSNFKDIQLTQKASIDASGSDGTGGIHLSGRQVRFVDGSVGLIQNLGSSQGGNITLNASELVEFTGTTPDGKFRSNLTTETTSDKPSGELQISTQDLIFREGGQIVTRTFAAGNAGQMSINASESVQVLGISTVNPRFQSSIFANSGGDATGNAGDVSISTRRFIATDGAIISNASFSNGAGGNFTLNAESVDLSGVDPVFNAPTDLRVGSFRGGDGGNLTLNARQVTVRDGGRIDGSTIGRGSAGNLSINASQFIDVNGGTITSSATAPDLRTTSIILLTDDLTGKAGGSSITTDRLIVRNEGRVAVQNNGPTNAGNLRISARSVVLDNDGLLSASTKLGEGGNINLQVRDALVLRHGSLISAEAGGTGNGGNITINSPVILGLENSDIIANAIQGNGGNINITTQGLFGLKFRDELTPESDITASSQFGINGVVQINNPNVDPSGNLAELPEEVSDPNQQIATGCSTLQESRFVVTGRGGLPPNPTELLRSTRTWSDVRDLSEFRSSKAVEAEDERASAVLVEATGWAVDEAGRVALVAMVPHGNVQANASNCTGAIQ